MVIQRIWSISCTILFISVFLSSCKKSTDASAEFSLNVRLASEPENLHPMLSKSSYGTQIAGLIILPAAEFDPLTMQLSPLLITEIPKGEDLTEGEHKGGQLYKMQFRPEATWDNGSPVTAEDYLFTVKAAFNPYVNAPTLRGFLSYLSEIDIDESDPKKVEVYVDSNYILSLEIVTNFNIYPKHIYDPDNLLGEFTLEELQDPDKQWTPEQDSTLKKFADAFQSVRYFREVVEGSGPYKLNNWATGEYISIIRKDNWWGDKIQDPPLLLQAYPNSITYKIITDAASSEAALKSGEIDVFSEVPAVSFLKMKDDPALKDRFHFETPEVTQIYYIEVNNRSPILSDKRIRQALAYSLDYDGIMNSILVGLGQRATGPIHPQRPYYNKNLLPLKQDVNRSLSLIKEAGWEDTNGNGIPDKMLNGKRTELAMTFKVTNRGEGQTLAAILKENAKKAGIDVSIDVVDPSQFNQDVRQFNFDLVPVRTRPISSLDDPYQTWHSESDQASGSNRSGFRNSEADDVIDNIRTAETSSERDSNFMRLQEILYEEQPAIFLYIPLERIMVSKKYDVITSARKPGYFENLFRVAE